MSKLHRLSWSATRYATLPLVLCCGPLSTVAQQPKSVSDSAIALRDLGIETFRGVQTELIQDGLTERVRTGLERAIQLWEESAAGLEQVGDHYARGQVFVNLAGAHSLLGRVDQAERLARRGLDEARVANRPDTQASALSTLANLARMRADNRTAAALLDTALVAIEGHGDLEKESQILIELGDVHRDLSEIEASIGFYEAALPLVDSIGDLDQKGNILHGMAQLHGAVGLYDDALELFQQAREVFAETGNRNAELSAITAQMGMRGTKTSDLLGQAMASDDCDLRYRALEEAEQTIEMDLEHVDETLEQIGKIVAQRDGQAAADQLVDEMRAELERQGTELRSTVTRARTLLDQACANPTEGRPRT